MVDFNRDYLKRKPEYYHRISQSDYDFLAMLHKHNTLSLSEGRLSTIEVCNNLLGAFLELEEIQCEPS